MVEPGCIDEGHGPCLREVGMTSCVYGLQIATNTCVQGKNTGIKAVLSGSQKKPLMTKVSMRHLNEIVRERNQYSRDAMEAWQDFINLKGRMDMELSKVTKRNNFLVEELESWKQQFLKFQAFAEQLTKETKELKVKIDSHKRENRRLHNLIEQQKDDMARLTVRLAGTEKQRDDALEALVLQQEIAEELERERKRNKKDLSALQHTNTTLLRQRDEAQRVVLHLRALIDGQAHHMEHIVKQLTEAPETSEFLEAEDDTGSSEKGLGGLEYGSRASSRTSTRQSQRMEGETDSRLLNYAARKRLSDLSMTDIADRQLQDKTDAIAYIIRNISEQCAAAVQGLDLVPKTDGTTSTEADEDDRSQSSRASKRRSKRASRKMSAISLSSDGQDQHTNGSESEFGGPASEASSSIFHKRTSQMPPTPDLVHDRSSTSMSVASESTASTLQRHSYGSPYRSSRDDIGSAKIVDTDNVEDLGTVPEEPATKFSPEGLSASRNLEQETS